MISMIFHGFSMNFPWISHGNHGSILAGAEDLQGRRIQLEAGGDRGDTSGVFLNGWIWKGISPQNLGSSH